MKIGIIVSTLLSASNQSFSNTQYQLDYCSFEHSQHVLDRIESEVKPIFKTYDVAMVNDVVQCPFLNNSVIEGQIKKYLDRKGSSKKNFRCSQCSKRFQSEDYLEFHLKTEHFKDFKMQDSYQESGAICPAELCDIFECPTLSEKKLAFQTFTSKTTNIEGKPDYRNGENSYNYNKRQDLPPYRYEMVQDYSENRKATLLQKCQRLFLDCVDYKQSIKADQIMKAFDFYSQIYCAKFEEGHFEEPEQERVAQFKNIGVYAMVQDIRDEEYKSPSQTLGKDKHNKDKTQKEKDTEVSGILWWVAFIVSTCLCFLYCVGLYFTYFEDPKSFYKDFSNEKVPGHKGKPKKNVD